MMVFKPPSQHSLLYQTKYEVLVDNMKCMQGCFYYRQYRSFDVCWEVTLRNYILVYIENISQKRVLGATDNGNGTKRGK